MANNKECDIFINKYISKYANNTGNNALYIHTPFCLRKCKYCVYHAKTVRSYHEVARDHIECITEDIKKYRTIFERVHFDEVYF